MNNTQILLESKTNDIINSLVPDDAMKADVKTQLIADFRSDRENYHKFTANPQEYIQNIIDLLTDEKETPKDPDTTAAEKATNLDKLVQQNYAAIANEFKLRFRNDPNSAESLAGFLLKIINGRGNNAEGWRNYIKDRCRQGKNKAEVQNKMIPTLVKAYNERNAGKEIELPRQVNDDQRANMSDRNGAQSGSIVIPEGFNQSPIELGNQAITMDFGYPAINFNSILINEIQHEDDENRRNKLLDALIRRIKNSPSGKALITNAFFESNKRNHLYKLIKLAASANGIPMLRRPLKVKSDELVDKSENDMITVIPLNAIAAAKPAAESMDLVYDPLFEGFFSRNKPSDLDNSQPEGKPVEIPASYLKQFYTILVPSGPTGLHYYARYTSKQEYKDMKDQLGPEGIEEITNSNRNIKDMILQHYIAKTNGVPPFYLLTPRTRPSKERLRVCEDTETNGMICIKSIAGKNKDAYFMDKDKIDSIFEAG